MKLEISTIKLQSMVARAMKGAAFNKLVPLPGLMCIQVKDGMLKLITTDGTNYLYISEGLTASEDFYVVVGAEKFSKLVSKLTCTTVTLELDDDKLNVIGNGKYSIELPLNEEGELVVYPDPIKDIKLDVGEDISMTTIRQVLNTAKKSLYDSMDAPVYTGYYISDRVIATDINTICSVNSQLWDEPVLISGELMDLLDVITDETVQVQFVEPNVVIFVGTNCTIYGKVMPDIETFAIDSIDGLLSDEYPSTCTVLRDRVLQVLDRMSLFVGPYDNGSIGLRFTDEGIEFSSKQTTGVEVVSYNSVDNIIDFKRYIDIEMLKDRVKTNSTDKVTIHYGRENALKITDGNVVHIIAFEITD